MIFTRCFDRESTMDRTTRLLNAQAVNLDVADVRPICIAYIHMHCLINPSLNTPITLICISLIPIILHYLQVIQLVPSDWPVSAMSSFLTRSFRRTVHASHEGQIIKAISSGQNLEVRLLAPYRLPFYCFHSRRWPFFATGRVVPTSRPSDDFTCNWSSLRS